MLFNSWQFIFVFLPALFLLFKATPADQVRARRLLLLGGSIVFYAWWDWRYVFLLSLSILINHFLAERIALASAGAKKRLVALGVGLNLLLLGYYKYTNFFVSQWEAITGSETQIAAVVLPLAISFFTFTQIAYLVDVFRNSKVHYGLLDFALFVYFFPHLIAGPILRHWEVIPQFIEKRCASTGRDAVVGFTLFVLGLAKKMFFADTLQPCADTIFGAASAGATLTFYDAWLGTLAFGLQIYFDFSGYSDMAIGLARMFGVKFPLNFNSPYKSTSLIDFWRNWHVTLSRFFREYVYFPLGGSRGGTMLTLRNVFIVMILSGIWHGAGWNFIAWGAIHGVFLVIAHIWRNGTQHWAATKTRGFAALSWLLTFLVVTVAWVFFRASSIPAGLSVIGSMFGTAGLSVPVAMADPADGLGAALQAIGVRFVPDLLPVASRDGMFSIVFWLMLVVLLLPNTQQLLARYEPLLESVTEPPRFQLALTGRTAFALGILFFFCVRLFFASESSAFVYFNF